VSDDRPITPEQALLAVKAAGLDPDRSLSEQLEPPGVDEAVAEAPPTEPRPVLQPHERLARQLNEAQSVWHTLGGPDGDQAA
jgi:hypothetical protein